METRIAPRFFHVLTRKLQRCYYITISNNKNKNHGKNK